MTLCEAALWYARQGLLVFPCEPREKRPIGRLAPNGYHDASADIEIVTAWWDTEPNANVGLPCVPNRFLAWDIDPRNGGDEAWAALCDGQELPETVCAVTGSGGRHFLFQIPDGELQAHPVDPETGEKLAGLDIKANGYIVVANSVHPCGDTYRWVRGHKPGDLPIATMPEFLRRLAVKPVKPSGTVAPPAPSANGHAGPRLTDEEVARRALAEMSADRADDYEEWVTVGQAARSVSDNLFADWCRWSARSSKFPGDAECRRKWDSFRGQGRTLGTLVEYARQDGSNLLQPGSRAAELPKPNRRLRDADAMPQSEPEPQADGMPVISTEGRQLREVVDDALDVLAETNDPPTFLRRSGRVVRVQWDETDWPTIADVGEHALRGRLARMANWHGSKGRVVDPPTAVSQTILSEPDLPLPPLIGLTQVPTMRADGTVLSRPGYDPATKLFYAPPGDLVIQDVAESPTAEQVDKARSLLLHIIADFPFVDDASRANVIATWLTPVNRASFTGPVGCSIVDAPSPGTGKSLLVECICRTASGRSTFLTAPSEEDEWRKRLTALFMGGASVIVIDNISGVFKSDQLSAAITADWWEDRELGKSGMVRIQQRATWIATGNNIALGGDLPRRCYHTRLDAECARPWEREGFAIEDLRAYVDGIRGDVLAALLTLSRAWWAAGRPKATVKALGGFEPWSHTIAGIMAHAGIDGFLGNQEAMYERADEGAAETEAFLRAWHYAFGDRPVRSADVVAESRQPSVAGEQLRAAWPAWGTDKYGNVDARNLGVNLRAYIDRRFGQDGISLKRAKDDKHAKIAMWNVVLLAGSAGSSGEVQGCGVENGQSDVQNVGNGLELPRDSPHSPQADDDDDDPWKE